MEKPQSSEIPGSKSCPSCGEVKPFNYFYRTHKICKSCTRKLAALNRPSLEEEAAAHVIKKKIVVEEDNAVKAIAQLMAKKKRDKASYKRRQKKLKELIPQNIPEEEKREVDAITQELVSRELARRKLIEFIQRFHPRYLAGWVHHDICRRLEQFSRDVADGLSPRLMLLMPPRHGKSQIASKLYPAWHLGHYPHHEFIGCSYGIDLARDFSREIRDVIKTDAYEKLFPETRLNPDFSSGEAWRLKSETSVGAGGYNAAGIGGAINGKGAHILVVDDPIKNAEEADSTVVREGIWAWFTSTAYTRLAPGGGVLVIMTLWHDDDLAGRLHKKMLEDPEADQYEIVKYPAIAEEDEEFRAKGEALHAERFDLKQLGKIKNTLGDRFWGALYQQNPVPSENAFFDSSMFVFRDGTPQMDEMDIYQSWDFAITEEAQRAANWTVGVTIGMDQFGTYHVLERVRIKTNDSSIIENSMLDMYARYKEVRGFGVEDGQIWRTLKSSLQRRMKERNIFISLTDENILKPIREKSVRARPLQARMQNKKLTFPKGQEWVDEMRREFIRFPGGVQDDQIDAMAWCVRLMVDKDPPRPKKVRSRNDEKTVSEKLRSMGSGGSNSHMAA